MAEAIIPVQTQGQPLKKTVSMREIASLVWPQTLMMFFQFLIGFTDVTVAGYIHMDVQAAFGFISQCLFFLLVVGIALANGGVAAMSQALGAKLPLRATRYVGLLFKVGAMFCGVVILLAYNFRYEFMDIVQVPANIMDLTIRLWVLYLFMIPGQYLISLSVSIFRSRKNVWTPFWFGLLSCVLNVVGSLALGLGMWGAPDMGAMGLVVSNLVSVWAGALFNLFMLHKKGILSAKSFGPWRWEKKAAPYVFKVALPAGANQILWQLGYIVLFSITATLPVNDVVAVAGLTSGLRIEGIIFLPTMAFSFTAAILVGHCLGAGDRVEAKRVALRIIGSGILIMSLLGVVLAFFVDEMSSIIAQDQQVRDVAKSYLFYNILAIPFTGVSMIVAGIMNGAGASLYTCLIYSTATWFVRLPLAWYMGHVVWRSAEGVFVAMLVSQVFQASFAFFVLMRYDWYRFASTAKRMARSARGAS